VRQLQWLWDGVDADAMDWNLMFVDDGCPNDSGKELLKLMDNDKECFPEEIRKKITVEFLAEGLESIEKFKNDENLQSVNDSRKGGAVQYGFFKALEQQHSPKKPRLIMYTDADLSADLSQSGLLLRDLTIDNPDGGRKVVIADRYSKGIFSHGHVMGTFKTNEVALRLRSLFRGRLLPPFRNLNDTQCGFKVFERECIEKVLPTLKAYQGMFDMELLLKSYDVFAGEAKGDSVDLGELIYSSGVVWLHSAEETNFGVFTPNEFTNEYGWKHFNQLQQIIAIHRGNYAESTLCEKEWVEFITTLSWKQYFQICQIVYLRGIDVKQWSPDIEDLRAMLNEKYPENAPKWIEDPSKK